MVSGSGSIRVGFANEPPFAYLDRRGTLVGEAPTALRLFLAPLGITDLVPVRTEFGALIRDLLAGRFDVIAAGMFVTPDRCRRVLFSEPTIAVAPALAVPTGNPLRLDSLRDIASMPNLTLGVVAGAVEESYARELGVPQSRIVLFPDSVAAMTGLRSGRIAAYAATALTIQALIQANPRRVERVSVVARLPQEEIPVGHAALGFRFADRALRDAVNEQLRRQLGTPAYLSTVAPYGVTPNDMPWRSTDQLCRPGR